MHYILSSAFRKSFYTRSCDVDRCITWFQLLALWIDLKVTWLTEFGGLSKVSYRFHFIMLWLTIISLNLFGQWLASVPDGWKISFKLGVNFKITQRFKIILVNNGRVLYFNAIRFNFSLVLISRYIVKGEPWLYSSCFQLAYRSIYRLRIIVLVYRFAFSVYYYLSLRDYEEGCPFS